MEAFRACEKCQYSVFPDLLVEKDGQLECRIYPPTVHLVTFPQQGIGGTQIGVQIVSAWPKVAASAYCGSYIPRDIVFNAALS